jgi:TatD DNase family protein
MEMGFHISFSGIVTFKSAVELQAVATQVPLDRLLIETDAPYLAPVPFRGKSNEPRFVPHVAAKIGALKSLSGEEVGAISSSNYMHLFNDL